MLLPALALLLLAAHWLPRGSRVDPLANLALLAAPFDSAATTGQHGG
jgi:hypothetical protein